MTMFFYSNDNVLLMYTVFVYIMTMFVYIMTMFVYIMAMFVCNMERGPSQCQSLNRSQCECGSTGRSARPVAQGMPVLLCGGFSASNTAGMMCHLVYDNVCLQY